MSDLETIIVCNGESQDERNQYEAIRSDKLLHSYNPTDNGPHRMDSDPENWVWIKGFGNSSISIGSLWTVKRRSAWERCNNFDLTPLYEREEVMPTKPAVISKYTKIITPEGDYTDAILNKDVTNPEIRNNLPWRLDSAAYGEDHIWLVNKYSDWIHNSRSILEQKGYNVDALFKTEEKVVNKTFQELVAKYASKPERSMQTRIFEILNHETFWGRDEDIQIQIFRERFINNPEFCSAGIQKFLDWIPPKWAEKLKPNRKVITATLLIEAPMDADPNEQLDSIMDFLNDWINPHSGFTGVDYRDIGEEDYLG